MVVPKSTWLLEAMFVVQVTVAEVVRTLEAATAEITGGFATVTGTPAAVPTLPVASRA